MMQQEQNKVMEETKNDSEGWEVETEPAGNSKETWGGG